MITALKSDLTMWVSIVNLDQKIDLCVEKPRELNSTCICFFFFLPVRNIFLNSKSKEFLTENFAKR